jgi:hypothetical protein
MRKRKYPSEINTRLVRVSAGDYAMLAELSQKQGVTMAEAFRLMLEHREAETRASAVSPTHFTQITRRGILPVLLEVMCEEGR